VIEDYGYLNARVRGMSSRLLAADLYPALMEVEGLEAFADRLSESPLYRKHIERERAASGGLDIQSVETTLLATYAEDVGKVQHISAGSPRRLIDLHLTRYDLHNVRTLVRGLACGRASAEIVGGTIPLGSFRWAELEELARAETVQGLAATLVTWGLSFGEILRQSLKAHGLEEDMLAFDVALDGAYYPWAVEGAGSIPGGRDLADVLAAEVDLRNIVTLLKLARQGVGVDETLPLVVRGGALSERRLAELAAATGLRDALEVVARTPYAEALHDVEIVSAQQVTGTERGVEQLLVRNFGKLFRKDPLGFSTILGYLWRRHAEYTDLRLVAHGLAFGLSMASIRPQLIQA